MVLKILKSPATKLRDFFFRSRLRGKTVTKNLRVEIRNLKEENTFAPVCRQAGISFLHPLFKILRYAQKNFFRPYFCLLQG